MKRVGIRARAAFKGKVKADISMYVHNLCAACMCSIRLMEHIGVYEDGAAHGMGWDGIGPHGMGWDRTSSAHLERSLGTGESRPPNEHIARGVARHRNLDLLHGAILRVVPNWQ